MMSQKYLNFESGMFTVEAGLHDTKIKILFILTVDLNAKIVQTRLIYKSRTRIIANHFCALVVNMLDRR